jgi:hypothetical protein
MRIFRLAFTAAIALGSTSPLIAQQHANPASGQMHDMAAMHCGSAMGTAAQRGMRADSMMQGMMPGMMHGMMQMMGPPSPGMILSFKQQLGLSSDQVTRLETLQKQAEATCAEDMRLATTAHQAADKLLDASSPDLTAYTGKLKEASAHMVEGHVAMAKAAVEARTILTAAQLM